MELSVDWIKHVETKGLTTDNLTFSIEENRTYYTREGTIQFWHDDGSLLNTISVKQEGRIAVTSLELDKESLRIVEIDG